MYVQPELAAFANQKYTQFKQRYPMFETERLLRIVCDNIQQSLDLVEEMASSADRVRCNQLAEILDDRITTNIDQEELAISRQRIAQIRNSSRQTDSHQLSQLVNNNTMKQGPRTRFFGK